MGDMQIGNVSFDRNDVKSSSVIYKDGQKINCVFLKNGTKLQFGDQRADANAGVQTGFDAGNGGKEGTGFSNITGLTVEGTQNDDYYHVFNCEDYNINVKDGGRDEVRIVDTKHRGGTVEADTSDKVDFVDTSKFINMNEGFFTKHQ